MSQTLDHTWSARHLAWPSQLRPPESSRGLAVVLPHHCLHPSVFCSNHYAACWCPKTCAVMSPALICILMILMCML